jgi:hypothetical protein
MTDFFYFLRITTIDVAARAKKITLYYIATIFHIGSRHKSFKIGFLFSFTSRDYFFDRFALSVGYRHIDCAKIYLNVKEVGQVFGQTIGRSVQREELFIVGKVLISYPCRFPENEHDFLK